MRPTLVCVRGGQAIPSLVSPEDEAERLRGRTQTFRFEPEALALLRTSSLSAILLDVRAELARRHQEHVFARRLTDLAAAVSDSDDARERLFVELDAAAIDQLEFSRLVYERDEWESAQGGRP